MLGLGLERGRLTEEEEEFSSFCNASSGLVSLSKSLEKELFLSSGGSRVTTFEKLPFGGSELSQFAMCHRFQDYFSVPVDRYPPLRLLLSRVCFWILN